MAQVTPTMDVLGGDVKTVGSDLLKVGSELRAEMKKKNVTKTQELANALLNAIERMKLKTTERIINPVTESETSKGSLITYLRGIIRKANNKSSTPVAKEEKAIPISEFVAEPQPVAPNMAMSKYDEDLKDEKAGGHTPAVEIKAGQPLAVGVPAKPLPAAISKGKVVSTTEEKQEKLKSQMDTIKLVQKKGLQSIIKEYENRGEPLPDFLQEAIQKKILDDKLKKEGDILDYLDGEKNIIDYMAGNRFSALMTVPHFTNKNPIPIVETNAEPVDNALFQIDRAAQAKRYENALGTDQEQKPYLLPFNRYIDLGKVINNMGFRSTQQLQTTSLPILNFQNTDPPEPVIPGIRPQQYRMAMTR